jgi:hypothetical protein
MSKEKKIKLIIIFINVLIIASALLHDFGCHKSENIICSLFSVHFDFFEYLAWFSLICFPALLFTLFISDTIFKKWLIFTAIWIALTIIFVALTPVSGGGPLGLNPDKEMVSIWMSSLFVIISIPMFIIMSVRERKKQS